MSKLPTFWGGLDKDVPDNIPSSWFQLFYNQSNFYIQGAYLANGPHHNRKLGNDGRTFTIEPTDKRPRWYASDAYAAIKAQGWGW